MSRLHLSRLAEIDLVDIWEYVADDNFDAADQLVSQIHHHARVVATQPRMGRERFELGPELRSFVSGDYLLFYRPLEGGGISLVRVIHGRRDITAIMFGGA